ncbi:dTDP-4-dehydrorhamnose reductase [candidate division KSB1 bacterium]|nr:MAG: dTDP-4-dehydrorhamnose reductase [candidate division KSB1 bacterium]
MKRVLITGSGGMLGSEMVQFYSEKKVDVIEVDISNADVTKKDDIIPFIFNNKPDLVIHCAGYTNVDICEEEIDMAYKVNAVGIQNVCLACKRLKIPVVYFSTDYVFDGLKQSPYIEFDVPNPLNVYGKSKLAGEIIVKDLMREFFIIRTSWLCGHKGRNFVETILNLSKTRDTIGVVDDQVGSPTFVPDLIKETNRVIESGAFGVYHISNKGICSWFNFAKKIIEYSGISNVEIVPIKSSKLERKAKRPLYSKLKNYMLELTIGDNISDWEESLRNYLK